MPVTAKLSKAFYERFGEKLANELVDWFNQVDATYRADLRELNEVNYARFEAKLEQRISELRSTLREELAELRSTLREQMTRLEARMAREMSQLRTEMADLRGQLRSEIKASENRILRWIFASWASTIGIVITLLRVLG